MSIGLLNTLKLYRTKMYIGYVASYPPRRCGIATFTADLVNAVAKFNPLNKAEIIPVIDDGSSYEYGSSIQCKIIQSDFQSYVKAADYINKLDLNLVNIQHEFGLFGGEEGEYIIPFIEKIKKPIVVTLHTVLSEPSAKMKKVVHDIGKYSDAIVVLVGYAAKLLIQQYGLKPSKIFVIPHGVPELHFYPPERVKKILGLENKIVLSTFGLINKGKGIEYAIEAIPKIINEHPNILYLILGATHPQVKRQEGENYRELLENRVKELKLEEYVQFQNRFLPYDELIKYLIATDIYIIPYLQMEQISSGTLAYAIGAGRATVSTPFIYAREMLANNRGLLVPFKDSDSIALAVNQILGDVNFKNTIQRNAYKLGRHMIWINVGKEYVKLFRRINILALIKTKLTYIEVNIKNKLRFALKKTTERTKAEVGEVAVKTVLFLQGYPPLKLTHLKRLTDDTGIIQHAIFSVPDKKTGYCVDDNARALICLIKYYKQHSDKEIFSLINTYLSFIHYAYIGDGKFHNFMGYDRRWLDEVGSEDSIGRSIWALGYTYYSQIDSSISEMAKNLFDDVISKLSNMTSLRAIAFVIMGLSACYERVPQTHILEKIKELSDILVRRYKETETSDWNWFEAYLTYANGRLPQALFCAFEITKEKKYLEVATKSINFLSDILIINGELVLIGNEEWYEKDGDRSFYDQQPIDAGCMVEAFLTAYKVTKQKHYYDKAWISFNWFFGKNSSKQVMYDAVSGGCFDGLYAFGINRNQGAESVLAYLSAYIELI
ncbi:MAG: glycosyltransferase [Candidatus Firestonebacteria bacterium]